MKSMKLMKKHVNIKKYLFLNYNYMTYTEQACEYFEFEGMTYDEDGGELESVEEVEEKARLFLLNS